MPSSSSSESTSPHAAIFTFSIFTSVFDDGGGGDDDSSDDNADNALDEALVVAPAIVARSEEKVDDRRAGNV